MHFLVILNLLGADFDMFGDADWWHTSKFAKAFDSFVDENIDRMQARNFHNSTLPRTPSEHYLSQDWVSYSLNAASSINNFPESLLPVFANFGLVRTCSKCLEKDGKNTLARISPICSVPSRMGLSI